jgi:hypothetical protein
VALLNWRQVLRNDLAPQITTNWLQRYRRDPILLDLELADGLQLVAPLDHQLICAWSTAQHD